MRFHPLLQVVNQRTPIRLNMNARQAMQGAEFIHGKICTLHHMQGSAPHAHDTFFAYFFLQTNQVALHRHEVGTRLGVDHHKVTGQLRPCP